LQRSEAGKAGTGRKEGQAKAAKRGVREEAAGKQRASERARVSREQCEKWLSVNSDLDEWGAARDDEPSTRADKKQHLAA